jgi:hypothetical protein
MCLPTSRKNISSNTKILGILSLCGLPYTCFGHTGYVANIIQAVCDFFAAMHYKSLSGRSTVESLDLT